jgi:hypothetical protein
MVELTFVELALTTEQIASYNLPGRPPKSGQKWDGDAYELDALHPRVLVEIVEQAILQHVDMKRFKAIQVAEESERELLEMFGGKLELEDLTLE